VTRLTRRIAVLEAGTRGEDQLADALVGTRPIVVNVSSAGAGERFKDRKVERRVLRQFESP